MPKTTYQNAVNELYGKEFPSDDPNFIYSTRNPVGFYQDEITLYKLLKLLNRNNIRLTKMNSILDIGCGIGLWLRLLSEIRGSAKGLTGIDLSESRIQQAQRINGSIQWIKGDMCNLPFDSESFDFTLSFVSFMFLKETKELQEGIREAARVTKKNGFFLFYDILGKKDHSKHTRGFQERDIIGHFKKEGLELVDKQYNFKNILWLKKFTTSLLPTKLPIDIVWLLERLPLGGHTHVFLLFRKHQ